MLALAGCSASIYKPPVAPPPERFTTVLDKDFETTWKALLERLPSSTITIDKADKATGVMQLSFGSSDPELYVDCGDYRGDVPLKRDSNFSGPYIRYRRGVLATTVKVSVTSLAAERTEVRIKAVYVVMADRGNAADTWAFESGSAKTLQIDAGAQARGTDPSRTCLPTNKLEKSVLETVSSIDAKSGRK